MVSREPTPHGGSVNVGQIHRSSVRVPFRDVVAGMFLREMHCGFSFCWQGLFPLGGLGRWRRNGDLLKDKATMIAGE